MDELAKLIKEQMSNINEAMQSGSLYASDLFIRFRMYSIIESLLGSITGIVLLVIGLYIALKKIKSDIEDMDIVIFIGMVICFTFGIIITPINIVNLIRAIFLPELLLIRLLT